MFNTLFVSTLHSRYFPRPQVYNGIEVWLESTPVTDLWKAKYRNLYGIQFPVLKELLIWKNKNQKETGSHLRRNSVRMFQFSNPVLHVLCPALEIPHACWVPFPSAPFSNSSRMRVDAWRQGRNCLKESWVPERRTGQSSGCHRKTLLISSWWESCQWHIGSGSTHNYQIYLSTNLKVSPSPVATIQS